MQEQQETPRKVISVGEPVAGAPYSQGIVAGNTLYCSGCIGLDPETNNLGADIKEQTGLALERIKDIVQNAEFEMDDVVKSTVFLKNLDDFTAMNEMYKTYFPKDPPARETVAVAGIVREALVEISCIAVK
ncbi:hypothetical protein AMJ80_00285 [bacterium SM23_31]|nr:MAG: hypothetical protein AMJ80_00285 [bacterium SM23_31]